MIGRILFLITALCLAIGCIHVPPKPAKVSQVTAPFERYISPDYDWTTVKRIVLMPFANQVSAGYPRVGDEMQMNLATELQRVGRFEVVVGRDDRAARAQDVFASGQFNELEILRVAREHQADAVVFANVTQYSPYSPPRLGVSLVMISPTEGIAIASASGVWDAREKTTANQMNSYYQRTQSFVQNLRGSERVMDLPHDFQRFVCQQVAVGMTPTTGGVLPPGAIMPPEGGMPEDAMMPQQVNMQQPMTMPQEMVLPQPVDTPANQGFFPSSQGFAPTNTVIPNGNLVPPIPPAPMETQ